MSKKLLSITIGGSLGGLLFVFAMILIFSPDTLLKGWIKGSLRKTSDGRARVESLSFGWWKGLELSNFILLDKGVIREEDALKMERSPAFQARRVLIKFVPMALIRGKYIVRELEALELEAVKGVKGHSGMSLGEFNLKAARVFFAGNINLYGRKGSRGENEPVGEGHAKLDDCLLRGGPISAIAAVLGWTTSGESFLFKSISTDLNISEEGRIYLNNFLADGEFFDLKMEEGSVLADRTLDCNLVIVPKEKVREKFQKLFNFSGTKALQIPLRLTGSVSNPRVSIKAEEVMEDILRGLFQKQIR